LGLSPGEISRFISGNDLLT